MNMQKYIEIHSLHTHAQYYWVDVTHRHRYGCGSHPISLHPQTLNAKHTTPAEYCDSAIAYHPSPVNDVTYIMYANATAKSSLLYTRHTYV